MREAIGGLLSIAGLAIIVIAVIALVRGRLDWARLTERRRSWMAFAAGFVTLVLAGAILPKKAPVDNANTATSTSTARTLRSSTVPASVTPNPQPNLATTSSAPAPTLTPTTAAPAYVPDEYAAVCVEQTTGVRVEDATCGDLDTAIELDSTPADAPYAYYYYPYSANLAYPAVGAMALIAAGSFLRPPGVQVHRTHVVPRTGGTAPILRTPSPRVPAPPVHRPAPSVNVPTPHVPDPIERGGLGSNDRHGHGG